jgi:phosphate/sulfate permease
MVLEIVEIDFLQTAFATVFPILKNVPILGSDLATVHYWSFNVSPGVFGQGMMTGPTMTSHMLVGAIVGWGILLPLARSQDWIIDAYNDWESTKSGWVSWIALSILVADSLVQLGCLLYNKIDTQAVRKLFIAGIDRSKGDEDQHPLLDRRSKRANGEKSSIRWLMNDLVLSGITIAATIACTGITTWSFDGRVFISTTIGAVCLSLFLSIASVRVVAMGDRHPVGGLGTKPTRQREMWKYLLTTRQRDFRNSSLQFSFRGSTLTTCWSTSSSERLCMQALLRWIA